MGRVINNSETNFVGRITDIMCKFSDNTNLCLFKLFNNMPGSSKQRKEYIGSRFSEESIIIRERIDMNNRDIEKCLSRLNERESRRKDEVSTTRGYIDEQELEDLNRFFDAKIKPVLDELSFLRKNKKKMNRRSSLLDRKLKLISGN